MPQTLIQISPKDVLDFLSPLIGTLIGGLIAYLSIRSSENRKRAQEKQDKIQDQRREAIKIAFQWIDPISNAVTKVTLRSNPIGKEEIKIGEDWPDLIQQLSKYDVPRHLAVFLPQDTYKRSFEIIRRIDDLKFEIVKYKKPINNEQYTEYYNNFMTIALELQNKLDELQSNLEEEYRKTFL